MAIYTISDLHLSLGIDKPMDIFGVNWENHEKKISGMLGRGRGGESLKTGERI